MSRISDSNDTRWRHPALVRGYRKDDLRAVEAQLFAEHAAALAGRVLELGCGAGRVTGHLARRASELHAIDISPAMIAEALRRSPGVTFHPGDMTDLSAFADGSFSAVVATCNVIDVLDDAERRVLLVEIRRVLHPDGVLLFSSHNRVALPRIGTPWTLPRGRLRGDVRALALLPRRLRNRRRLRPLEVHAADYDIITDQAHDWSLLHYYIAPSDQARQLRECGLEPLGCRLLDGTTVTADPPPDQFELYYAARPAPNAARDLAHEAGVGVSTE